MTPVGQISPPTATGNSNLNTSGVNAAVPGTAAGTSNEVAVKVAVRVSIKKKNHLKTEYMFILKKKNL